MLVPTKNRLFLRVAPVTATERADWQALLGKPPVDATAQESDAQPMLVSAGTECTTLALLRPASEKAGALRLGTSIVRVVPGRISIAGLLKVEDLLEFHHVLIGMIDAQGLEVGGHELLPAGVGFLVCHSG